ncbi:MAG: hypothetical protein ACK55H_05910 [Cyanobacteriota bacterium]|jgi:hypothetical protein
MLSDFQRALVDLSSSVEFSQATRNDPSLLQLRYRLTPLEARRLTSMVRMEGMTCNLQIHRTSRLASLMVYLTDSLHALGPLLEHLLVAYWSQYPRGLSYFALECERFLHWLHKELNEGRADLPQQARQILRRDQNRLLQEMADAITVTSRHRLAPPSPAPAAGGLSPRRASPDRPESSR